MNNNTTRDKILSEIKSIEKIPGRAGDALVALQDPESDTRELSRIIEYDPGLTSTILHLVNSASFGGSGKISTIKDAIVRMGRKQVFVAAISSIAKATVEQAINGYGLKKGELWKHMVFVGVCSEVLPAVVDVPTPDGILAAGLLHDIGKVVLGEFLEIDCEEIYKLSENEGLSFEESERQVLGIDHAEIGAILLAGWNVPENIIKIVHYHHRPDDIKDYDAGIDIVHAADNLGIISGIGTGDDGSEYRPSSKVYKRLGLSKNKCEEAICQAVIKMDELSDLLE